MSNHDDHLIVYYDGACPRCVADRQRYERLAGRAGEAVQWVDITGRDDELKQRGIDPDRALRELHVQDGEGQIHRELDAYILLMRKTRLLRPVAWLIGLPGIRGLLSRSYHAWVDRRLRKSGRG
ncbi:thiol-disulfide oxidoreductase DCC family protein [Marinimicrobium sp. LS-A18]|uniref:thiol-disulfide oxidoreductase DCC family protein n=1 Tax=Marinimicrobium sp. LS-A18 TaxID=1381596 RepID=UPI0004657F1D|nr:DUF393 domain-containing protein [Marinimicrobium sp. LS-A18]